MSAASGPWRLWCKLLWLMQAAAVDKPALAETGGRWAEIGVCGSHMELTDGRGSEQRAQGFNRTPPPTPAANARCAVQIQSELWPKLFFLYLVKALTWCTHKNVVVFRDQGLMGHGLDFPSSWRQGKLTEVSSSKTLNPHSASWAHLTLWSEASQRPY